MTQPDDDERLRAALAATAGGMSLARAAKIAGVSLEAFMERASAAGIPVLTEYDDEDPARPNLLTCSDEQLAATKACFEELERQMWPALAALGNQLDADQVPTRSPAEWLWSRSPMSAAATAAADIGKWIVEREWEGADSLWALVHGATQIGRLWAAKASGLKRATFYGGRHAIIVYVPGGDLEAARASRAVLRELGVREEIRFVNAAGDELLRE